MILFFLSKPYCGLTVSCSLTTALCATLDRKSWDFQYPLLASLPLQLLAWHARRMNQKRTFNILFRIASPATSADLSSCLYQLRSFSILFRIASPATCADRRQLSHPSASFSILFRIASPATAYRAACPDDDATLSVSSFGSLPLQLLIFHQQAIESDTFSILFRIASPATSHWGR